MDIGTALAESAKAAGWSTTKVAAEAGVTEESARLWLVGKTEPRGGKLLILMDRMPGLRRRIREMRRAAK